MNTSQADENFVTLFPVMPPRSRLNSISPIGVGSSLVESLTSYVTRLANSHCLPVGIPMEKEIAPIISKVHGGANLHKIYNHTSTLNSTGIIAFDLVQALEKLTGQEKLDLLTLINWSNLLPQKNLLRHYRAWCPICYQEWCSSGQVVYERLLWSLETIKICPVHHCFLCEICPHCYQKNLCLAWHTRSGYCSKCQKWLGLPLNELSEDNKNLLLDELKAMIWIAESVEGLLARTCQLSSILTKETLSQAFRVHVNRLSGGNIAEFARLLQLPKNTVWLWCNGKNLPKLNTLVQICYRLNRSLIEFVTQEPEQNIHVTVAKVPTSLKSKPKAEARTINVNELEQHLDTILMDHQSVPMSMEEVARQIGIHRETIFRLAPEKCRAISARYDEFQKSLHHQAIEQSCKEVKQAVLKLYSEGLYPSEGRVSQLISRPGYLRYKQVRAAIEEAKLEFNPEVANSSHD